VTTTANPRAPARDVLTETEATARVARVSHVSYDISLVLARGVETFRGDCTLSFRHHGPADPLFIDFRGRTIERLEVNGRLVEPRRDGERIVLDAELLAPSMTVRVAYENAFDHTGDGFHRFVDPEDGAEYLYTNFQPFAAHRVFPCFDQPDLKATYRLTVDVPADWGVVTSDPVDAVEDLGEGRTRHRFPATRPFSTYLLSLVAGPFFSVHRTRPDGVTLGLFCRRSMERHLRPDADELFDLTDQGFDFFIDLFGQAYPFRKYDQLFVPEFNIGAMENIGAVTFTETFVFRDPPTERQRQDRAEVILHELAHMWFGNLVTMRWWNDLWLNESFATYVAYLAQAEATRFTGAWKSFVSDIKRWAYRQDQLPTTHPIRGVVADTDVAFLDFDGITYGKGASVLKQLVATIGRDGFRAGIQAYFRRHAWGNATLADFLSALEEGSGRQLGEWARLWLETASLNTIAARWEVEGDRIARLRLEQTAPIEHPVLRPHTLVVGLVSGTGPASVIDALPARLEGAAAELPEAVGRPSPSLVFPNHEDHAYAKVSLDPASLAFSRERLGDVGDPLLRELLWMSLWEMVRDGELSSLDFLAIIRRQLPMEPDVELLQEVLARTRAALRWYVPETRREAEAAAMTGLALEQLPKVRTQDARIAWSRAAIASAATPGDLAPLLELADGTVTLPDVTIDQQMRWDLCIKASAFGMPGAVERAAEEARRDGSDRGQRAGITASVALPDEAGKADAWRRIHDDSYGSFHLTRAAMEGFQWPHQHTLLAPYDGAFFDRVRGVFETRDMSFATTYLTLLFPDAVPSADALARGRRILDELRPDEVLLARSLREKLDDVARALRVRAVAEEA
jgi:aminopeptidase N